MTRIITCLLGTRKYNNDQHYLRALHHEGSLVLRVPLFSVPPSLPSVPESLQINGAFALIFSLPSSSLPLDTISCRRGSAHQLGKTRLTTAFQVMKDVAAVVAAAAGSSRGIGIKGNLVRIISMYLQQIRLHVT